MAPQVLCIGHAAYDLSVFVDDYPAENSKCESRELMEGCGGPAANAAYLLAKWGVPCGFVGLVGADGYGRRIADELDSVGVDTRLLELLEGHQTPHSVILVNRSNGSRTIVTTKVPTPPFAPSYSSEVSPKALFFDGHELQAALTAMERYPGVLTMLDAGSLREGTERLASRVTYLAASERFALQCTGLTSLADEAQLTSALCIIRERFATPVIIVTLGERGLIWDEGSGMTLLPAFPAPTVDTTCAGDIFHGALMYGILRSMALTDALKLASMASSLSVRQRGGRSSMPELDKVKSALVDSSASVC